VEKRRPALSSLPVHLLIQQAAKALQEDLPLTRRQLRMRPAQVQVQVQEVKAARMETLRQEETLRRGETRLPLALKILLLEQSILIQPTQELPILLLGKYSENSFIFIYRFQ
jgi:hypothetical protein